MKVIHLLLTTVINVLIRSIQILLGDEAWNHIHCKVQDHHPNHLPNHLPTHPILHSTLRQNHQTQAQSGDGASRVFRPAWRIPVLMLAGLQPKETDIDKIH